MSALTFEAYWPLVLLLGLPLLAWLTRRQRTSLSPRRVRAAAWSRAGVLVALTLALMRPAWQRPEQQVAVVYAVDVSHSMSSAYLRSALEAIRQADAGTADFRRYVVFGDRARVLERAEDIAGVAVRAEDDASPASGAIDQGVTDIEAALTTAVLSFPAHMERHLVLISDGRQTRGDVWRVLPRLRAEHVRVYTLPAQGAPVKDAWVAAVHLPEVLREREPFLLHAQVQARSAAAATVELRQADRLLDRQSLRLLAGENEVLFETQLSKAGAQALSVKVVMAGDEVPGNDTLTRNLWVGHALRVLHVGDRTAPLVRALGAQGLQVTATEAGDLPTMNFGSYDTIVLNDVPADALKGDIGGRLESSVRDQGTGLVFVAGENAYGKSAFAASAVERLLPIKFEGKRKRKDLDLVLLIDRSYSMRGKKLEIAKTAALSTLDLLEPQHRFAVVAFDARPHDVVPLAEVGGKRRAEDLISSMTAGGQTNVYNALFYAHRLLEKSTAKTKHIILLSDGITALAPGGGGGRSASEEQMALVQRSRQDFFDRWRREHPGQPLPGVDDLPPDPPPGTFEELASSLLRDKITLSTVALGEKPNLQLLANLANWAEGKSYVAVSDNEIPGLFISEAQRLLGESMIEEPFRPLIKVNGAALTGLDFEAAPALKGFVVSKPKRFADVLLEGKRKLPLMVETRYGLGKTVAFLSDARNRWAADWLAWPGYGKFWSQVVRDAARRDRGQTLTWDLQPEDDGVRVTLTALTPEGRPRDGLAPVARVDGGELLVRLQPSAPGVYTERVRLEGRRAAAHGFELVATGGLLASEIAQAGPRTLALDGAREYRTPGTDQALLRTLSEATGGVFAPALQDIRRHHGDGGLRSTSLWWPLAALALLLYLVELFVRRSPWGLRLRSPDQ